MRALVQRVLKGRVTVDDVEVGCCGHGFVVLLGIKVGDTQAEANYLAKKIANLRVFADENGKLNRSVCDIKGELLLISQFTLYGDCRSGNRPGFSEAASPPLAEELYEYFSLALRSYQISVQTGIFGEDMQVELINDGPVTLMLEK